MPDPLETTDIASSLFVPPKAEGPRRKMACEVCSDQSGRPIMLEEGGQMEAHLKSRSHRKRVQKRGKNGLGVMEGSV
jgi:tRNA dimethylallyltransferase